MVQPPFEASPLAPRRSPEEQARDRDLGFGAVVSRESRQRLLNRDGSFNVARSGLGFLATFAPYHLLLTISWRGFLAVVGATYLVLNLVFAVAYVACGPDALSGAGAAMLGGRFSQAFFFSIQTFATIGYGQIAPNGLAANLVVTVEALVGLMYQALATGLLFARFTRPTAALLFSARAVVGPAERLLSMIGEWRLCFFAYAVAFLSNAALCVLLIPFWGSAGAGVALSTALVVESILLWTLTKRIMNSRFSARETHASSSADNDGSARAAIRGLAAQPAE